MPVRCLWHKLVISAASGVPAVPSRTSPQRGTRNTSASALNPLGRSWIWTATKFGVVNHMDEGSVYGTSRATFAMGWIMGLPKFLWPLPIRPHSLSESDQFDTVTHLEKRHVLGLTLPAVEWSRTPSLFRSFGDTWYIKWTFNSQFHRIIICECYFGGGGRRSQFLQTSSAPCLRIQH